LNSDTGDETRQLQACQDDGKYVLTFKQSAKFCKSFTVLINVEKIAFFLTDKISVIHSEQQRFTRMSNCELCCWCWTSFYFMFL